VPFVPPKRSPKKLIQRSETEHEKKSTVAEPPGKRHCHHHEFPETTGQEEIGGDVGRLPQEAPLSWFPQFCGQPTDSETKADAPTQHLVSVRAAGL
jgi:hypothetical protein